MDKYDKQHDKNVAYYRAQIDAIYKEAAREAALIGCSLSKVNPDRPFSFADYPVTKKRLDKLLSELSRNLSTAIVDGVKSEWTLANKKNSELCRQVFGDDIDNLTDEQRSRYFSPREQARDAFIARKENGLALSDRVWKYTDQFKNEIELGLDCGIRAGTPAPKMTQELQGYLRNPDKLFRRVRDERGVLHLSKAAADYHPGRGVYRSSYKNSLRLAGSETNIAYRTADYLASQDQDFVVGIRIEPSKTNHTIKDAKGKPVRFKDICDDLAGDYPKDFKFVGWHPNCRCHVLKIQKTIEEMKEDNRRIMEGKEPTKGSSREVKELPQNFREWVGNNSERIANAKQLPYFIRDNKAAVDGIIGVKKDTEITSASNPEVKPNTLRKKSPIEIALERHNNRTPEQEALLRKLWEERQKRYHALDIVIQKISSSKVEYNEVKKLDKSFNEDVIISRLGGGDKTEGSCSSLAFAYAGNKCGFDVLDFRNGQSRREFANTKNIVEIARNTGGKVVQNMNDFVNAKELLSDIEQEKEYYFTCGSHAAIVRKGSVGYEYLELQSEKENGFKPLTDNKLKHRFKAQKSHTVYGIKYGVPDCIIPIENLKKYPTFRKLLGYINTQKNKQVKGDDGKPK